MQAPFYNYGFQSLGQSMHYYPCPPPPLIPSAPVFSPPHGPKSAVHIHTPTVVQQEPRPSVSSPLWLCFVRGNISRCNGCKGKIGRMSKKILPPPDDVVLRHKETVVFQNPNTVTTKLRMNHETCTITLGKRLLPLTFATSIQPCTLRLRKQSSKMYFLSVDHRELDRK